MKTRRCNQCCCALPAHHPYTNCDPCRKRLRLYHRDREEFLRTRPRRVGLDPRGPLRVRWTEKSHNRKLGPIPTCIVSASTCPPSCALYGNGCYAEAGHLKRAWRTQDDHWLTWGQAVARVRALPPGQLWRYATAGDLPGRGERVDAAALGALAAANAAARARGFTFTHKRDNLGALRDATAQGVTINLSVDRARDVDRTARRYPGLPLVCLLPENAPLTQRTQDGRKIVVCPAERNRDVQCASCGLCALPERQAVIGFRAHGSAAVLARRVAAA